MHATVALALAALVAFAAAAPTDPLVSMRVQPENAVIAEGRSITLTFSLKFPIQCDSPDEDKCKVVFLLTNTRPDDLALSACHVEWNTGNWKEERTIVVSAVEDFIDDGQKEYVLVTEPMISDAPYYNGVNPPDITITTQNRPTAQCSSVTDPNINTFDGRRFTYNNAGTFLLWAADHRDFEVQTRVSSGRNCGTAIRDGCDTLIFDSCATGDLVRRSNIVSSSGYPTVHVKNGNTYVVTSPSSGAEVKIVQQVRINRSGRQVCGWSGCRMVYTYSKTEWQDVYVTAPGNDWGYEDREDVQKPRTHGLCGSFDSNRDNDPTVSNAGQYAISGHSLFQRYKPCVPRAPPPPVDYSKCVYDPKPIQRPIVSSVDLEDITELIKNEIVDEDDERVTYVFQPRAVVVPVLSDDEIAARISICQNAIRSSTAASICEAIGVDVQKYVENCVADATNQPTDADELVFGNVQAMNEDCQFSALKDPELFNSDGTISDQQNEIFSIQCPGECGFDHGKCVNGACQCEEGWMGVSCQMNATDLPNVTSLLPFRCDARAEVCEHFIAVLGDEFLQTDDIACVADGTEVEAMYVSDSELRCRLPTKTHSGADEKHVQVSVTINGKSWSDPLPFVYFDSKCQVCLPGGECYRKEGSCAVNGVCYSAGEESPENPCLTCQPDKNTEDFSFSYVDAETCGAHLTSQAYTDRVRERVKAGTPVLSVSATNEQVLADPDFSVRFSLSPEADGKFVIESLGKFDAGIRTANYNFDFEAKNEFTFDVIVTDHAGNVDKAPVTIRLINANDRPVLTPPEEGFDFVVPENGGAMPLFQAEASDEDALSVQNDGNPLSDAWSQLTYHISGFKTRADESLFSIDETTGEVKLTTSLDFEWRERYDFKVHACDGAFECDTADVSVTVLDVNEKPEYIRLNGDTVPENSPAGVVVGTLSTDDPDNGQTHRYVMVDGAEGRFDVEKLEDGSWAVVVAAGAEGKLNFETGRRFTIVVRSIDSGIPEQSLEMDFGLLLLNANDDPTALHLYAAFSSAVPEGQMDSESTAPPPTPLTSIPENVKVGTPVGVLVVDDEDRGAMYRFELVAGDISLFQIVEDQLILAAQLDFESTIKHTITVEATGLAPEAKTISATFSLTVEDVDEAPRDIKLEDETLEVDEFAPSGSIGFVTATDDDPDQPMKLTLANNPNGVFELGETTCPQVKESTICRAELFIVGKIDFELRPIEYVTILATSNADGLIREQRLAIRIKDSNDAPTGAVLTPDTITEFAAHNALVGVLTAVDPDAKDKHTFVLAEPANTLFAVKPSADGKSTELRFVGQPEDLHFETQESHEVRLLVTDNADAPKSVIASVTVNLINRPVLVKVDIDTGAIAEYVDSVTTPSNRVVGSVDVANLDIPSIRPRFLLVDDFDGAFVLRSTGLRRDASTELVLTDASKIDGEKLSAVPISIHVEYEGDINNKYAPKPYTAKIELPVSLQNEAPVFTKDAGKPVLDVNAAIGTAIVHLAVEDPDTGDVLAFSIEAGNEEGLFRVDSQGRITYAASPSVIDFLEKAYNIRVRVTDQDGLSSDLTVPITLKQTTAEPFDGNKSSSSSSNTGIVAGGVIAGLVALAAVAAFVVYKRAKQADRNMVKSASDMARNPMYDEPSNVSTPEYQSTKIIQGKSNPLYDWYKPDLTREDCVALLETEPDMGAFIIRDYTPTPGWYMMHTKLPSMIRDDKIRFNPDGSLQIASPSVRGGVHPCFGSLPQLVKHYASPEQQGLPMPLVVSNPIYDNRAMGTGRDVFGYDEASPLRRDINAPALPLKDQQVAAVAAVAGAEDMYFNAQEAKSALQSRARGSMKKGFETDA